MGARRRWHRRRQGRGQCGSASAAAGEPSGVARGGRGIRGAAAREPFPHTGLLHCVPLVRHLRRISRAHWYAYEYTSTSTR